MNHPSPAIADPEAKRKKAHQSQAIVSLQARWNSLADLDRAEEVSTVHESGVSLRGLAKKLTCSEGLLRHLLQARQASPEDLTLARAGRITTSELVRRSVVARTAMPIIPRQPTQAETAKAAVNGFATVGTWLAEQNLQNSYGIRVVKDARELLVNAEKARTLPTQKAPNGLTLKEIIERCRPPKPDTQGGEVFTWYARWLAIWAC
jgi:hypothetical protein